MSNPAVFLLAQTNIRGNAIRIEDNLGESIHIHLGDLRISVSIWEFKKIALSIIEAAEKLLELENLSLDMFDMSALDWDWLWKYEKINQVQLETVKLKQLLTSVMLENEQFQVIVPISESRQFKALNGNSEDLLKYKEENMFGQTNESRLWGVLECIKSYGYPYDGKYIMTNQYYQIYDGDHRASCLYYLYGENYEIPIIKIEFDNERDIQSIRDEEKRLLDLYKEKKKEEKPRIKHWSEEKNICNKTLAEFIDTTKTKKFEYFLLEHPWQNNEGKIIADVVMILEENTMVEFCKELHISYYGAFDYRYYNFLYSMQRVVYVELLDKKLIVCDRICCESLFEKAILPLDKSIQVLMRKDVVCKDGIKCSGKVGSFIFIIVNAMLNKHCFDSYDIEFIKNNIGLLDDERLVKAFNGVFFSYTNKLIEQIKNNKFNDIFRCYLKNCYY